MSLTRQAPALSTNPANHFHQFKCGRKQGHVEYYDKEKTDEKGNKGVNIKSEFFDKPDQGFFVIESNLMCITGWNDAEKFSLISNEVFNRTLETGEPNKGILTVTKYPQKGTKSIVAVGTYPQIKEQVVTVMGGSYTQSIYFMTPGGMLDHLKISGLAFAEFNKFCEDNVDKLNTHWIYIKEWEEGSKGNVEYKKPIFAVGKEISKADLDKAMDISVKVDEYLDSYMKRTQSKGGAPASDNASHPGEDQIAPREEAYDTKKWRDFDKHEGGVPVGAMSVPELYTWQQKLIKEGETNNTLFDCICTGLFEYENAIKKESWKTVKTKDEREFGSLTLDQLKLGLNAVNGADPKNWKKLYLEAGIKVLTDAQKAEVVDGKAEVVSKDESPF